MSGPSDKKAVAVFLYQSFGCLAEFHRGIARFARIHADWSLMLMDSASPELGDLLSAPGTPRPDGAIVCAYVPAAISAVVKRGLPAVNLVQTAKPLSVPMVCPDNTAAGRIAAEYLLGLGLRRLGYVSASFAPDDGFRLAGFVETAKAKHAACGICEIPSLWERAVSDRTISEVGAWVGGLGCPCGVLTFSDGLGSAFVRAARLAGFRVPEDVAVVGIDDDDVMCEYSNPPLSSVNMNYQVVGYEAAALLDRMMSGKRAIPEQTLIAPIGIIERESSQMLAVDDDLAKVLGLMIRRLGEPLSVGEMATHVQMSERSLQYKFKKSLGHSPAEELMRLRVERGKKLLIDTEISVGRIALQTGFTSPGHFCRAFKQATGVTPGQYRRARRGGGGRFT